MDFKVELKKCCVRRVSVDIVEKNWENCVMKKILGMLILGLLTCNISFADSLRVVDGDTIVLNGEKIRFTGIDTPELKQTCMHKKEEVDCGMNAKMLLVKKIGNNTPE